jgi:hypothetical protein
MKLVREAIGPILGHIKASAIARLAAWDSQGAHRTGTAGGEAGALGWRVRQQA